MYSKTFLELVNHIFLNITVGILLLWLNNYFVPTYQKIIEDESKNVENFQENLKKCIKISFINLRK